jgi:uncharacterized protein YbcI
MLKSAATVRDMSTDESSLSGGELLSAISTNIVALLREHYGRGPTKAKTYVIDDLVICVLRSSGYTPQEQTLVDAGRQDRVIEMRREFQTMMGNRYRDVVEDLTGRKVIAVIDQAHLDPDVTLEAFLLDAAIDDMGAIEITGLDAE